MDPAADEGALHDGMFSETHSVVAPRIGLIVGGNYRITRHIASGGSSHVFEAEHVRLGSHFAIKLLRPELDPNRRTAQRFRREARAIARLKSEHIVSVVDCGELDDGTPYLVMERLEGEDLRSLLNREGSLPARRAVPLIIEACRGLTHVHAAGLVHRDLKPENLFITKRSNGEDWCKVLDFGVAKMESSLSTAEGAIVGTTRYMAPEQLADSTTVAAATDVYALAAILYECLAGRALVVGDTVQEVMYHVMNAEPISLNELVPTMPRSLTGIVERCVRKSPTERPSSAQELALMLEAAIATSPRPATMIATSAEDDELLAPVPRPRATPSWKVVGVLAAALGTAGVAWYARGPSPVQESVRPGFPTTHHPTPKGHTNPTTAGMPLASSARPEAPLPGASASPKRDAMPKPSSTKPPMRPQSATSAVPRARAMNGFDSANPYAE